MPATLTAAAVKKWTSPDHNKNLEEQKEHGSGGAEKYKLNTLIEHCTQEDEEELHSRKQQLKTQNERTSHLFVHNHRFQINKTAEINAENTLKVHGL